MGRFDRAPVDRAAGGVVVRRGASGLEVAVIHRARYDDWTLPKGHVDDGETWSEAALREVREETGIVGEVTAGPFALAYPLPDGLPKIVVFFAMSVASIGIIEDTDEVDAVEWWPVERAVRSLSYIDEQRLVADVAEATATLGG
jgi:8-oxo-(d)GTP phosphatase